MLLKKNKILFNFVIPYIAILIFALIIGVIVYQKTLKVVENEVKNGTMGILEQTKEIINMRLEEVESISHQLRENPKVLDFKNTKEPFKGTNTYKVINTQEALYEYSLSNQFIFNYFLLFESSNVVMNETIVDTLPKFYQYTFKPENLEYDKWYQEIMGQYHQKDYLPAREYNYKGKSYSFVTYVDSMGFPFYYQGALIVLIDNNNIKNLLKGIDTSDGGWVYVADEKGRIISYVSDVEHDKPNLIDIEKSKGVIEQKIDSKDMMVTYTKSEFNGWTYVAVQPTNIVMEKVNYINKITIAIILTTLLIGLLISFYLAYRNAKPIKKLFQNHEELQQKIKEQKPILRSVLFERVFKGEISTQSEIEILMQHIGINIKGKYYLVVLLYLPKQEGEFSEELLEKLDVERVIAKDVLSKVVGSMGDIHDVEEDKIALLLRDNSNDRQECRDKVKHLIKQISNELHSTHHIDSVLSIGNIYEDLIDISRSFEEANQALNYKISDLKNEVIWYDELLKESYNYYYPSEVELRLTNLVKSGDEKLVIELLDELYRINFEERKQSLYMLRFFLCEMWGSIVKLLDQVVIDDAKTYEFVESFSFNIESMDEVRGSYQNLTCTYRRICNSVNQKKKSSNTQLINKIVNYIKGNFMQPDLSLTSISDEFNITEAYLSRFFKDHKALNLSEYIEKMRMEHAEVLLNSTDLPVGEVGKNVGYSSINTFGRAFKRKNGISPSAYRNSIKAKKSV